MLRRVMRDEKGQSAVIMALIMVVILALFALVIDIGNAYAERRRAQNAADAAALAGAQKLADASTTNRAVIAAIKDYAQRNGMPADGVTQMCYTDLAGACIGGDSATIPDNTSQPQLTYGYDIGVKVVVYKEFATYFARVLKWDTLPATADSTAFVCYGANEASNLYPMALSKDLFKDNGGVPVFGQDYTIWNNLLENPGNFGWVNWGDTGTIEPAYYSGQPSSQNSSQTNLANNMHNTERSGTWKIEDWVPGTTGNMFQSSKVVDELTLRKNGTLPSSVVIPIYSEISGEGANTQYKIYGFASFRITAFGDSEANGNGDWYVTGRFERWATATPSVGGPQLGAQAACYFPPSSATKTVTGDVKVRMPVLQDYSESTVEYPMDIVLVMDKSGSMADKYTGSSVSKLTSAKNALKGFLTRTDPDPCSDGCTPELCPDTCRWLVDPANNDDKVSFVSYPTTYSGSSFKATCSGSWSKTYYVGKINNALTADKDALETQINAMSASGWTPIAGAMYSAISTVQNNWRDDSFKFIILASDGMANVPLTGQPTEVNDGYYGPLWPYPDCNLASATDAIAEASLATNDPGDSDGEDGVGAVVFTIAIGAEGNFNTTLLEAMASQKPGSTDKYFYNASNAEELEQAYEDIQREIEEIKEGCSIGYNNMLAEGATVKLKSGSTVVKTTQTSAGGNFTFSDVDPGNYTIEVQYSKDGITFDTYVDQLGGAALSDEQLAKKIIVVPDDDRPETINTGPYYLQTSQAPACP